jgi:hypothetical protein
VLSGRHHHQPILLLLFFIPPIILKDRLSPSPPKGTGSTDVLGQHEWLMKLVSCVGAAESEWIEAVTLTVKKSDCQFLDYSRKGSGLWLRGGSHRRRKPLIIHTNDLVRHTKA